MAVDISLIQAEYNRLKTSNQSNFGENFLQMPKDEGSIVIRLLPPRAGQLLPFIATRTHKINEKNFHCPMNYVNGKWVGNCPICNLYRSICDEAYNDSSPLSNKELDAMKAEARAIKANERYYWNCIARVVVGKNGTVEHNVGPLIFSTGKKLQGKVLRRWGGDKDKNIKGIGDVTDPQTGRDLNVVKNIVKEGNNEWPDYMDSDFEDQTPLGNAKEIEQWLANLHDLTSLRRVLSQEELAREVRIYRGLEEPTDTSMEGVVDNDPEEITPTKVAKTPFTAKPIQKPVSVKIAQPQNTDEDEALADEDFLSKLKSM